MSRSVVTPFFWICWGIRRDPAAIEHYNIVAYEDEATLGAMLHEPPHSGRLALCAGWVNGIGKSGMYSREDMDAMARRHAATLRAARATA